jgi:iron complex outermembrane receptor protein
MVYFTYSKGWLTGAFNDELNANLPEPYGSALLGLIAYGPETVTNYEFGFKGTMFDGRLRLNADVFYMDYADKQEVINIDNSDGRFGSPLALEYTDNAANVDITGIEIELRASPWDGGFVSLDIGTLDSKYRDFQLLDLDTLEYRDATNTDIKNRIPDWTLTASVEHAFELANGATLTPQLGLYMQDDYEWQSNLVGERSTNCHQDSYSKWRLRATYEPADGNWQASVFGYNITDELILAGCGNARSGAMRWFHERPAWWGAEVTFRFGNN